MFKVWVFNNLNFCVANSELLDCHESSLMLVSILTSEFLLIGSRLTGIKLSRIF